MRKLDRNLNVEANSLAVLHSGGMILAVEDKLSACGTLKMPVNGTKMNSGTKAKYEITQCGYPLWTDPILKLEKKSPHAT